MLSLLVKITQFQEPHALLLTGLCRHLRHRVQVPDGTPKFPETT